MKFILHTAFLDTIWDHLGEPEYSYYFVLKAYQQALIQLGTVELVRDPSTEVDQIYDDCRSRGEPCVFLAFMPPHKLPLGIRCPTVPVIAWEFSTIPNEQWSADPRNDWRVPLANVGGAIALSSYSAEVIAEALGPDFMVSAVPAPIPDHLDGGQPPHPVCTGIALQLKGSILDTAAMNLQIDSMAPSARTGAPQITPFQRALRRGAIWPLLSVQRLGKLTRTRARRQQNTKSNSDTGNYRSGPIDAGQMIAHLAGIIYTAVLNPQDGRKNVYDIVTAFCWAFRDAADATLILKLVNRNARSFFNNLIPMLYQLSPFKCRVLVVEGFLEEGEYEALRGATSFYVNASTAEGLCLPLMEFMAAGVPAIAPVHTAMADYIDEHVAFTLRASRQITVWPHDPRDLFRTMCYRLDWGSLLEAYQESYRLAKSDPVAYGGMAERSRQKILAYASLEVAKEKLRVFLTEFERKAKAANATKDRFLDRSDRDHNSVF